MTLEITLPFGKKQGIKDLVFTILTREYPLRIIDLMNFIRKRYGKSVTFQAVRKSVLELVRENVLIQVDTKFAINKEWVVEGKKVLDSLYEELTKEKTSPQDIESINGEISVFNFDSLNELMKFWQEIIDGWFSKFKKGDSNTNCYQAAHAWEALLHPDSEKKLMSQLKNKSIKSYILTTRNTPLDKNIRKFYKDIGVQMAIDASSSSFDKAYYVGTYGETIVQTQYPKELVEKLDNFFKKNKTIENLNLGELSDIVNKKMPIKLTVIKDLSMANQINKSILSKVKN